MADREDILALLSKVYELAATLSEREQRMLRVTFYCASDPLDRMLMKDPLSDEEKSILARLENGGT